LFFLLCWIGYARWADRGSGHARSLMLRVAQLRHVWMRRMLARDVRIVDIQVIQVLVQSIAFFASSAVLIIGGAVAVLGSRDDAMRVIEQIPLAAHTPARVWEGKVLLVILVFVYAFFKFTWALRQFNFLSIMVGGAPKPNAPEEVLEPYARRFATLSTLAGDEFNHGIRAYYFGFAAMTWFVSAQIFIAFTLVILFVLWRRDFASATLRALRD
jgi:uncharacterized membrane protein